MADAVSRDDWSPAEKRIARAAFDRALDAELAELVAEFRQRVAALDRPALGDDELAIIRRVVSP